MENQSEITNLIPDSSGQDSGEATGQAGWGSIGEQLDLGLFFYSGQDDVFYLNPILREWLGTQADYIADENTFWNEIYSLAVDPAQARERIKSFLKDYSDHPLVRFPLKSDKEKLLFIQLFSLKNSENQETDYGGFVSKGRHSKQKMKELARIFDTLLGPARQLTSAVQGNLQALKGNLGTWSPEVLDQFLDDARDDLLRMCKFIDMGLIFSKVIRQASPFNLPVDLIGLIDEINNEQGYITVNLNTSHLEDDPLPVKIDRAMVKIALESLLKEVVDRNPDGQQLELRLSERDRFIVLNIDSPRILPLPGMDSKTDGKEIIEMKPEVYLANEILASQGGYLVIEERLVEQGGGIDIEVSLPISEPPRKQPIHHDWEELLGRGTGRILLAEAQADYQLRIRDALTDLGYRVDLAVDGSTVLDMIQTGQPRLVILDRNLPGMDGLLVTQGVRRWSGVPIIMISMRDSVDDLLTAYKLGVDDYLKKPFLIEELLAKVRVLLSRQEDAQRSLAPEIYQVGSIRIDQGTRQVWIRGNLVQLTPIEYNLLVYLSRQGRQIIPYEQLLEHVWEGPEKGTRQGLFVHVRRLREKIEEEPKNPLILSNKWGVGYVFNP